MSDAASYDQKAAASASSGLTKGSNTSSSSDVPYVWSKQVSSKHGGREYWFNAATGESRWTPPDGWVEQDSRANMNSAHVSHESSASAIEDHDDMPRKRAKLSSSEDNSKGEEAKGTARNASSFSSSEVSGARKGSEPVGECPADLLWKRNYLFRGLPEDTVSKLRMDVVASFSITESNSATVMTRLIADAYCKIHNMSLNRSSGALVPCKIFDGMACVGGNTMSFSRSFQGVLSNELDPNRFEMLKHNVVEVMRCRNVQFFNGSILELAIARDDYSILFLDPEWGGPDYKDKSNLRLVISDTPLEDFCLEVFQKKSNVEIIALKLPVNYDNRFIEDFARKNNFTYAFFDRNLKKMTLTLLTRKSRV